MCIVHDKHKRKPLKTITNGSQSVEAIVVWTEGEGKKTKRNFINCYVFECKQIIKVDSIASGQIEDGLTVRSLNNLLQLS